MKMVKSLLLGTAAGLVAMTGAQAADLPVKAKPVQYVKICSLYGAGFYYIPGTDMCLKIGGWVRAEYAYGDAGNMTSGALNSNINNRLSNDSTWRSRGYITADARNQSEYGTIRSYIAVGLNSSSTGADAGIAFSSNRAFIQLAGFTFGLTQSFYDFYSVPATAYWGSYPASDTGDPGWQVAAYTAQFGNGVSATLSAEMRRMTQIYGGGAEVGNAFPTGATGIIVNTQTSQMLGATGGNGLVQAFPGAYGGFQVPDVVANLRVDQAWGGAQIMAALHEVNGQYYDADLNPALGAFLGDEQSGGPSTKWGFALGAGLKLNAPMIGPGDYLQTQINYTQGASRYIFSTPNYNYGLRKGNNVAWGVLTDAVYGGEPGMGTATSLQLTTAWGFNAAYEHFWNKQWRTSLYGGYDKVSYNSGANAQLCVGEGYGTLGVGGGTNSVANAGCSNNWSTWFIGSRTQWNVTADTYLGLDVLYQRLTTATTGSALNSSPYFDPSAERVLQNGNMDNWSARFRVHKDFYP